MQTYYIVEADAVYISVNLIHFLSYLLKTYIFEETEVFPPRNFEWANESLYMH